MAVSVNIDPVGDSDRIESGLVAMAASGDSVAFRLVESDMGSALRLVVKPQGDNKRVGIAASAARNPSADDWIDPQTTAGTITADSALILTGWQVVRLTINSGGSGARVAFAARNVAVTHSSLPAASVADESITLPVGDGEVLKVPLEASGTPRPEPEDYSWTAASSDSAKVLASVWAVGQGVIEISLARLSAGQVSITLTGIPHHGGSAITATITVA